MPDLFDRQTFVEAVQEVLEQLGGAAAISDIAAAFAEQHPDLTRSATFAALRTQIRRALTSHDASGLPRATSLDGKYRRRTLFDPEHYQSAHDAYCRRSDELREVGVRFLDEGRETYPDHEFREWAP